MKLMGAYDSSPLFHLQQAMDALEEQGRRRAGPPSQSLIYYVQIDGLVKIGTTVNLEARLRSYPPTAKLLATEPGDQASERFRHDQFRDLLSHRREWFALGPALIEHINTLRDAAKQEPITVDA